MKKLLLLLYCGSVFAVLSAQVNADSLYRLWHDPGLADTTRLQAIHGLARSLLNNNPDSAHTLALQELELAGRIRNKQWQGKALNIIGLVWRYRSEFAKSLQYYEQSITMLEQSGDRNALSAVYGNMGDVYRVQSNFPKAIDCLQKSLTLAEETGDRKKTADAYVGIATIFYHDPGNTDKTREYLLKALAIYETLGNQEGMSLVFGNLSSIYLHDGDYENALLFNNKCMAIQEKRGDLYGTATSLHNRAMILSNQGRYTEALTNFEREIEIFKSIGDQEGIADAYISMGDLWIRRKRYAEAIRLCNNALQIVRTIGSPNLSEADACHCLYRAYLEQNNHQKALAYLEQYLWINDSLQSNETAQKLRQMELERQTAADSLEQEKEKFRMEMAHQQALRRKDNTAGWLIAGGLGALSVALAFWVRMLYFRRRSLRLQVRSEDLEKQQLLNEIALLRTQVNPHFLFNSLSILSSLVHTNPGLSEQYIEQLARSYRYILEQKDQPLVTLRTELEFIHSYAFLLKIRFENKFDLQINLQEDDLEHYKIAPLTLQLLVENAVKHNRMSAKEPLIVEVCLENEQTLVVKNRVQPRMTPSASTGIGLQNIINRYALLTDRPVWAGERADAFVVEVPLL